MMYSCHACRRKTRGIVFEDVLCGVCGNPNCIRNRLQYLAEKRKNILNSHYQDTIAVVPKLKPEVLKNILKMHVGGFYYTAERYEEFISSTADLIEICVLYVQYHRLHYKIKVTKLMDTLFDQKGVPVNEGNRFYWDICKRLANAA